MKITIEPTEQVMGAHYHTMVSVSVPDDDLNAERAVELALDALRAWGFSDRVLGEATDREKI